MTTRLYGIKACDTCRKAVKTLEDKGLAVEFVDVRATPLDPAQLRRFLDSFNKELINRRSTTWRGLSEEMREKEALDLLSEHPTLMKRPVIDHDGALYLGWTKEVQAAIG